MPPPFGPPTLIESQYRRALETLIRSILPSYTPSESWDAWIAKLAALSLDRDVQDMAGALAAKMVRWVSAHNAKSWQEAAARSQRSRMLYRLLQHEMQGPNGFRFRQLTSENAKYISSIPQVVAQRLAQDIASLQQKGARPEAIAKAMRQRFPELTSNRIKLIARTQVAKSATQLTQARCEDLGISAYVWRTSHDQRVRPSHRNMDGVVVFWDNAPSPERLIGQPSSLGRYGPGECPNCRCYPAPVLSLEDIFSGNSSVRVYYASSIVRMTRHQFAQITGIPSRKAA